MQEFHKAISTLENLGFEFVDTDLEANIIIKTKEELVGNKLKYKIVRASHICEEQIRFAVFKLLDVFEETEDKEFLTNHSFDRFEGQLGENSFKVKIQ